MSKTLVKLSAWKDWIDIRVITHDKKERHTFCVERAKLLQIRETREVIARDSAGFAAFQYHSYNGTVIVQFFWINPTDTGAFRGWNQTVILDYQNLMSFLSMSADPSGPKNWKMLSKDPSNAPRLVFPGQRNLKQVVGNKLIRRKLSKFLRDNFRWRNTMEIQFFSDFVPYSFFFREIRHDGVGIQGGLILHGQEQMEKAYYSIHT